ncbi:hypothetical protein DEF86_10455 [Streptococcus agalactiae]|nr:hypothetical protein DEF86_10455 [Streptococcus agalactiae]
MIESIPAAAFITVNGNREAETCAYPSVVICFSIPSTTSTGPESVVNTIPTFEVSCFFRLILS